MDKQVTKEQIGSVVALLVAGKVPHDDVQAFIDKYRDVPSKKKRKREKLLLYNGARDKWDYYWVSVPSREFKATRA